MFSEPNFGNFAEYVTLEEPKLGAVPFWEVPALNTFVQSLSAAAAPAIAMQSEST